LVFRIGKQLLIILYSNFGKRYSVVGVRYWVANFYILYSKI